MSIRILQALLLIVSCSCNGQVNRKVVTEKVVIESKSINNSTEADAGIIYFSFDNGIIWNSAGSGIPRNAGIGLGGIAGSGKLLGSVTKEYGIFIYNFSDSTWINIPTEKQIIDGNPGALIFYRNTVFVGTQYKGIFCSRDNGKSWTSLNTGLNNLSIRRFSEYGNNLYVCTNDGFYSLNGDSESWKLEYGYKSLQVNSAAIFNGIIYIATNRGVYKEVKYNNWENILPDYSVHNISSANGQLFAMTYNELFCPQIMALHGTVHRMACLKSYILLM